MSNNEMYTPEVMIKALQKSGGVIAGAARMIGCARGTVSRYIEQYAEVRAVYDEQNEIHLDEAENRLIDFVEGRSKTEIDGKVAYLPIDSRVQLDALKFYLRTKGRHRGYGDHLELAGDKDAPLAPIQVQIINAQHMESNG